MQILGQQLYFHEKDNRPINFWKCIHNLINIFKSMHTLYLQTKSITISKSENLLVIPCQEFLKCWIHCPVEIIMLFIILSNTNFLSKSLSLHLIMSEYTVSL